MKRSKWAARITFVAAIGFLVALWWAEKVSNFRVSAPMSVWFMPAANSPDITDLFKKPDQWADARRRIDAFVFSPEQVQRRGPGRNAELPDLAAVDAFLTLKNWGLKTVLQVPALKEWDCTARQTVAVTVDLISAVSEHGGTIQFLEMDEPLISALGLNKPICKLDITEAATKVAAYAGSVLTDPKVLGSRIVPQMVDIEAYPSLSVQQLETWITALGLSGLTLDAFHIDVDMQAIESNPVGQTKLRTDLQELQRFLNRQKIGFGIIIWSGHDPEKSDEDFYNHAMKWVSIIHEAISRPDRVAFESWVKRCSLSNPCLGPGLGCSTSDPVYCGTVSVPLNLPQSGAGAFSHTKLIQAASAILTGR